MELVMLLIKKDIFEVHKPSALITAKYSRLKKRNGKIVGEANSLLPVQHDAMNFLCYNAREQMHKKFNIEDVLSKFENDNELMEFLQVQEFSININEFVEFIDGYQLKQDKKYLFEQIDDMQRIQTKVGIFKHDSVCGDIHKVKTMSLIRNYTKIDNSNTFTFQLEPEILLGWMHNPKPYTKLFLKVQTKLKLTYSKILYEICKDYVGLDKPLSKEFNEWLVVLGIDKTKSNTSTPGQLKAAYLNKAIKEINEHTDIFIDDIKGKKENGITSMIVYFHSQDCSIIESDNITLSLEEQIKYNKKKVIAKARLEQSKKFQDINNEEAWLKKTIDSITDEFIEQQDLIEEAKQRIDDIGEEVLRVFGTLLMDKYKDVVMIKDYKLQFAFDETKPPITNNAKETYDVLLQLENDDK